MIGCMEQYPGSIWYTDHMKVITSFFGGSLDNLVSPFRDAGYISTVLEPGQLYGETNQLTSIVELPVGSIFVILPE